MIKKKKEETLNNTKRVRKTNIYINMVSNRSGIREMRTRQKRRKGSEGTSEGEGELTTKAG